MKLHTVTFQYRKNWLEPQECGHFRASCTPMPPNARSLYKGILIQQRPKSIRGNLRKDSNISESMFQISEMKMNPCNGRRVCQGNDVVALATRRNS